jgi:hypothetical protein
MFVKISALASKKVSNQNSIVRESKENHPISGIEARAEILTKISLVFWLI